MISPLVTWQIYQSLKLHFDPKSNFDVFKYGYSCKRFSFESYNKRRDKHFFERLSRKFTREEDCKEFFLANILENRDFVLDMTDEALTRWRGRLESASYLFELECKKIVEMMNPLISFDDLLKQKTLFSSNVLLLDWLLDDEVQLETVIIIDMIVGFLKYVKKDKLYDPLGITQETLFLISAYAPFLRSKINIEKLRPIAKKIFTGAAR